MEQMAYPKDWYDGEAEAAFAHRDVLPKLVRDLEKAATQRANPGVVLSGPPGVGKSAILRVIAGAFRQRKDWLVVCVADCGLWGCPSVNPQGFFLDRVTEGVLAHAQLNGGSVAGLHHDLGALASQTRPQTWEHPSMEGQRDTKFQEAVLALKAPSNTKTLLIFDEVNVLVEKNLLDTPPFTLAVFVHDLASGCRLTSGTPLHAYIEKLAAGYFPWYVTQVTPFNAVELDRWFVTPLGKAVESELNRRRGEVDKSAIAWMGGLPRSLTGAGRDIKSDTWKGWDQSKSDEQALYADRLRQFCAMHQNDAYRMTSLMNVCEVMFLGLARKDDAYKESILDSNLLSTSLFYANHANKCVPLNLLAEEVLWRWWALNAQGTLSRRLSTAMEQLKTKDDEQRGYALQTLLRYAVLTNVSHQHTLKVHRAFGGKPKPESWETLQFTCEAHVYESWYELAAKQVAFPLLR